MEFLRFALICDLGIYDAADTQSAINRTLHTKTSSAICVGDFHRNHRAFPVDVSTLTSTIHLMLLAYWIIVKETSTTDPGFINPEINRN